MQITIWGARGSIPAPGAHTLRYGGNSTCLEIRPRGGGVIVVDAGSGLRLLGKKLVKEKGLKEMFLLLTHSHWDHLMGFPFFMPAYFSRFKINVRGGPAQVSVQAYLERQMTAPYFPVDFSVMKAKFGFGSDCPDMARLGLVEVHPVPLSHPNGGYGFKFVKEGKTFVFLTDNELDVVHPDGLDRAAYVEVCRGADVLPHDAQYTDEEYKVTRSWGHSTYAQATDLALAAGVKRLGLFHHDPDRSDDDLDRWLGYCRERIKAAGARIDVFAASEGMTITL